MIDTYSSLPLFSLSDHLKKDTILYRRFVIFGNFGAYNMGDEAILAGQIEDLKKIKKAHITVISRYPSQVANMHKVSAVSQLSLITILKNMIDSDAVIVGGGGLLCKNDRGIRGLIFQLYTLGLFFLVPHLLRKKLFVWGIGIYSDLDRSIAFLCNILLRFASVVTVRDHASLAISKKWHKNVLLCKDNSFLMLLKDPQIIKKDAFLKNISLSAYKNVGIALIHPETKTEEKKLIDGMKEIIINEYKTTRFWFYHHDTHPTYDSDADVTSQILESLDPDIKNKLQYVVMPTNRHPSWLFSTFYVLDAMIALRLHASIFAYRFQLPSINLSYGEKCSSFIKATGKKPYAISSLNHKLFIKTLQNNISIKNESKKRVVSRKKGFAYAY